MTLALIGMLATVNPAAAALSLARDRRTNRPAAVAAGLAGALVVLIALAAAAEPLLDALDVNLGTYRLGAGVVMAVAGARWLVAGAADASEEPATDRGLALFVLFPALVTPGAATLAVSVGAEEGAATAATAIAVAGVLGAAALYWRRELPPSVLDGLTRLAGGVATVVGVLVAVDGIKTL